MLWVALAILVALIYTVVSLLDKYVITHEIRDPILATVFSGIGVFFVFGIVSYLLGKVIISANTLAIGIAAGIVYSISVWLYYRSMSKEDVSRFIPVLNTIPIFVVIFAFFFLGEKFSLSVYLGIILVVIGAILISIKFSKHHFKLSKAFFVMIITAILFALRNLLIKYAETRLDIWSIFFGVGIGGIVVTIILYALHHPHIRTKARLYGTEHLFLNGVLAVVALYIFTIAISMAPVSLVTSVMNVQAIFVFIAATVISVYHPKIIREKITKLIITQKTIAILLIIAGVILTVT